MESHPIDQIADLGEITVSYKYNTSLKNRPKINSSKDAYRVARQVMDQDAIGMQEQFIAIYLNRSNVVIGTNAHFKGGLTSVTVDIKIILVTALKLMASSVIVCYNHLSGNLEPSSQDKSITIRLKNALALLDIQLLDHIILTHEKEFLSFTKRGLL